MYDIVSRGDNYSKRELKRQISTGLFERVMIGKRYSNIYERYVRATDVELQRNIISSMFPEKITSDGLQHRTLRPSEPLELKKRGIFPLSINHDFCVNTTFGIDPLSC